MSKAILVFNAYETLKNLYGKEVMLTISIPVESKNGKIKGYQYHSTEEAILKPMPNKKIVKEIKSVDDIMAYSINQLGDIFTSNIELQTETLLSLGYNKCIDEILGGTDNE